MAWSAESASLAAQLRSYIERLTDAHARLVIPAWAKAWDDLAPELEGAINELALQATDGRIRRADVMRSKRLQSALETIRMELTNLTGESGAFVTDRLEQIVDYSGAIQERLIASQLPAGERAMVNAWSRVDANQVKAIVERTTEQITKRTFPLSDEATASMRRQLIRGVVLGENPRTAAGRMVRQTEGLFNGGLSRATNIARTEMLSAHREAAAVADMQNTDLLTGWVWLASLSARTCPACWGMSGQEFPPEVPGPDGHQQCRCTRAPKTKTWAELGFTGIEEPPSLLPDKQSVFDGLPAGEQRSILGTKRFDAFKAGKYPMSDWATKRSTPGWRDSYVPSKAPAA